MSVTLSPKEVRVLNILTAVEVGLLASKLADAIAADIPQREELDSVPAPGTPFTEFRSPKKFLSLVSSPGVGKSSIEKPTERRTRRRWTKAMRTEVIKQELLNGGPMPVTRLQKACRLSFQIVKLELESHPRIYKSEELNGVRLWSLK